MTTTATKKKPGLNLGKLSAVAQIAVQKPAQAPDAMLPRAKIYTLPQVRKTFGDLTELKKSIQEHGIIEPLVVHEEPDGRYRLIIGERRFRAATELDLADVPAIVKRGLTELEIRALQVAENNERENLTPYDEAMGVIEDVEKYGTKEAMRIWNRGEAWVSKRMAVKRYAEPVLGLLHDSLCGDFEVLHCLNQLHAIDEAEFSRVHHRLGEGLALSRDEARNTLSRVKAWKKQQDEFAKRRQEQEARRQSAEGEDDEGEGGGAPVAGQSTALTPEQAAAAARERALERLTYARDDLFDWSDATEQALRDIQDHMTALDYELPETEWVLWSAFLTVALPVLKAVGPDRHAVYLKRLQAELKAKSPAELWDALHPSKPDAEGDADRVRTPEMPEGWRL